MKNDLIFKLYSENDFSDEEYLNIRNLDIDVKSYLEKISKHKFTSKYSEEIINLLANVEDGDFTPAKVDVYDPIKETYCDSMKIEMLDWLSQAGGGMLCKRTKGIKYIGNFENNRISKIWTNNKSKLTFDDPKYLSTITLIFTNYNEKFASKILNFCNCLCELSGNQIAYLYSGVNFNIDLNLIYNSENLIKQLKDYNCELIKILK
jgi:hypothetical protein